MTAPVNAAAVGQAAELAVRAVDALMTWEAQAPRAELTLEDLERIAGEFRAAAALLDGQPARPTRTTHGYELTDAGREATDDVARRRRWGLVVVNGGAR